MGVVTLRGVGGGGGGVTDHGALTGLLDDDHTQYLLVDGTRAMGAALDMGAFDITNVGDVDGVDVSALAAAFTAHIGDATIHFTEASIDHTAILNIGTNSHAAIDSHIADATIHFAQGAIDHTAILNIGSNSHAAIDSHIADGTIHFTEASIDHGSIAGLADDDHAQYALLAGRAGGQTLFGGTSGGGDLTLQGRDDSVLGLINVDSPMVFGPYVPSGEAYAFAYAAVETFTSNFIGGGMNFSGTLTFNNSTFIYESFRGAPTINTNVNPGFAAYTVLQALPVLNSGAGAGHNPLNPLVLNAGPRVRHANTGTRTSASVTGVNFAATVNAAVSGATMNVTNWRGMTVAPNWDTVAGSTIDFGTIIGVACNAPGPALFGQSLGVERLVAYYGLQMANPTISNAGGTAPVAAVRSLVLAGTNKYFLLNDGTAESDFGVGDIHFDDAGGVVLGSADDVRLAWDGPNNAWNWEPAVGEDLGILFGISSGKPTYLFEAENFGVSEVNYTQIRFGFDRYAFGQTGTIGNQVGLFVAGNRTVEVAGGWSDYLLTQAGGLNIGTFAMSDVAAWTINQISLDNTAGSITSLDTLVVGGMTTSNPGITVTERSALRVRGRKKQEGSVQYPPIAPAALSAGDNDDWAGLLTGSPNNNGRYWARVTGNATTSIITGIDATAVQDGDTFELTNVGSEEILIAHQNTGSVAANRIAVVDGFSHVLDIDGTVELRYDATTARWRVLTPSADLIPVGSIWKFDTSTTMADPGIRFFRANNGTPASITSLAISTTTFKEGDASGILGILASGDKILIQQKNDKANFLIFDITGTTDNTTWFQIDGTVNESGTLFGSNEQCLIALVFA